MGTQLAQPNPCFSLGQVVATPGAIDALDALNYPPKRLLSRHIRGDWGDMATEDKKANSDALASGNRIFSAYVIQNIKFWVITEADRSSTTILLPSEY